MMRVAVISANLGAYDRSVEWVEQRVAAGVTVDIHRLTDETFPTRALAMTSRLQCGIPKMCGWELFPNYDAYLWVDASRGLLREDTVAWFLERAGDAELLLFLHPERKTIREEYDFIKARMARAGETYLNSRYAGEWLDEQYAAVCKPWYTDNRLYASTAFLYRPTLAVRKTLQHWFYMKARYLLHDQLALPFVVREHGCHVRELSESVYGCEHLPMVRLSQRLRRRAS